MTETVSARQQRLFSGIEDARRVEHFHVVEFLVELFSLFQIDEERVRAIFIGTPAALRERMDDILRMATLLQVDIGLAIRKKYPGRCFYCDSKPCTCGSKKVVPRRRRFAKDLSPEGSVEDVQRMLVEIYPDQQPLIVELHRVGMEIGELGTALLSSRDTWDVEEELADIFARFARLASSLGVPLEDVIP